MHIRSRLAFFGFLAVLATLLAQAADMIKPNIKLGLWAVSYTHLTLPTN